MERGITVTIKKHEDGSYKMKVEANDGLTPKVFLPHKGGSLIRFCEGGRYSLTTGLKILPGGEIQAEKNMNWEGEMQPPSSEGIFFGDIDPEEVIVLILREREKIKKFLAEGGEVVYKFTKTYSSEEE